MKLAKTGYFIHSGYQGKEVGALLFNYPKESFSYSAIEPWNGQPIVGSIEFVEGYTFIKTPNYFPEFLDDYLRRDVRWIECLYEIEDEQCFFAKPADRHKRFDARIVSGYDKYEPAFYPWQVGPYWISDIVHFKEEWRYYIAKGEVLAAYWYLGEEKEIDAPELNIDWPKDFSGAVDFGRLFSGEIALVENNLPYACGWYGPHSEGKVYGEWLEKSWNYVLNSPNIGV